MGRACRRPTHGRDEIQNKILIVNPEEKKALVRSAAEMKEFFLYPLRLD
jgi:hypothetical protein